MAQYNKSSPIGTEIYEEVNSIDLSSYDLQSNYDIDGPLLKEDTFQAIGVAITEYITGSEIGDDETGDDVDVIVAEDIIEGFETGGGTTDVTGFTPVLTLSVNTNRIKLTTTRLSNLTNHSHFRFRVSDDASQWYELNFNGENEGEWKTGTTPGYLDFVYDTIVTHEVPLDKDVNGDPENTVLYYQSAEVAKVYETHDKWKDTITYIIDDIVYYNGSYYQSLQNSNTGNTPDSSPTWWDSYIAYSYVQSNWSLTQSATATPIDSNTLGPKAVTNTKIDDEAVDNLQLAKYAVSTEKLNPDALAVPSLGLLAYWSFDNIKEYSTGFKCIDYSGNSYDGTIYIASGETTVITDEGPSGYALGLNTDTRTLEYVLIDGVILDIADGSKPYTISGWIKTTDSNFALFAQYGTGAEDYEFYFGVKEDYVVWNKNGVNIVASSVAGEVTDNDWHCLTASRAMDGTVTLYIDGVEQPTTGVDTAPFPNANCQLASYDSGGGGHIADGYIDEVRVYNRVLSLSEIVSLYAMPQASASISEIIETNNSITAIVGNTDLDLGTTNLSQLQITADEINQTVFSIMEGYKPILGLIGYWGLDEGSGITAYDGSDFTNNGTLTNFEPIAEYHFDGDCTDSSGNGNDATFSGGTASYGDGVEGQAIHFDGSDDYVECPAAVRNVMDMSGAWSVAFWINLDTVNPADGDVMFWSARNSSGAYNTIRWQESTERLYLRLGTAAPGWCGTIYSGGRSADTWYHVVVRYGDDTAELFVDNVSQGTIDYTGGDWAADDIMRFGGWIGTSLSTDGSMDDARVYDYCISDDEIDALYNRPQQPSHWTKGVSGNALICNGDGYVDVGSFELSESWTISLWSYAQNVADGNWNTLFRGVDNNHHVILKNDTGELGVYDNEGSSFIGCGYDGTQLENSWHHLVIIGNDDKQEFYVDTEYVGEVAIQINNNIRSIGNYFGGSQPWGIVDEVRIYNRVLTSDEILILYNNISLISDTKVNLLTNINQNATDITFRSSAWEETETGTVKSHGTNTITLADDCTDDVQTGDQVLIYGSDGSFRELQNVLTYDSSTNIATVEEDWVISIVDNSDTYEILRPTADAKIKVSSKDGGYILLDANKVVVPGTISADLISTQVLNTLLAQISSSLVVTNDYGWVAGEWEELNTGDIHSYLKEGEIGIQEYRTGTWADIFKATYAGTVAGNRYAEVNVEGNFSVYKGDFSVPFNGDVSINKDLQIGGQSFTIQAGEYFIFDSLS